MQNAAAIRRKSKEQGSYCTVPPQRKPNRRGEPVDDQQGVDAATRRSHRYSLDAADQGRPAH